MPEPKRKKFLTFFILSVLPAAFLFLSFRGRLAAGPFWLGVNSDPSYIYLISSLHILDGIPPIFVVHPGTTLQVLGAAVFRLMHPGLAADALIREVLLHPEVHLQVLHAVLLCFFVLSLGGLSVWLWQRTRDFVMVLLVQLPAVFYLTIPSYRSTGPVLTVSGNVIAETLLMTGMNLFNGVMLALLLDRANRERSVVAAAAGTVCGLCLATKFTVLPLALAPFLMLRGIKRKSLFVLTMGMVWLAAVSPVIARFPRMFRWLTEMITHTGMHGSGGAGFIRLSTYGKDFLWVAARHPLYPALFLAALAGIVIFWRTKRTKGSAAEVLLFLTVVLTTFLIEFLVIAKQPEAHYITPLAGFSVLPMIGVYRLYADHAWSKKAALAFVLAVTVFHGLSSVAEQNRLREVNDEILSFSRRVRERYADCALCGYYRSSSIPIALDFGNDCYGLKTFGKLLNELYPDQYFFNYWKKRFHDFEKWVTLEDIKKKKKCVILYGSHCNFSKGFLKVEPAAQGSKEAAYRVLYSTVDRAIEHYLTAKSFEARKNFRAAYVHALTAQKLGFPDIEPYLRYLRMRAAGPQK